MAEVENVLAQDSLAHFIRQCWRAVETRAHVGGWHIDAICDHLEAVSRGEIHRLIINVPPRHMKSLAVSVFWPMWDWLSHPERQWLFASYAHNLSIRDSVKSRRVFQSMRYQDLLQVWQPGMVLTGDQNTKIRFENNFNGYRLATSVDGSLTGEGGDIIVIDDPHNVIDGESETSRIGCLRWWDEAMSTRLNDSKTGSYVIIMQRVHENDLTGHILAREHKEWDHLCLPARYEGKHHPHPVRSSLGWKDPRRKLDDLLWPTRFPEESIARLEKTLGSYGAAGQLQQRPAPRGGGMFPIEEIQLIPGFARNQAIQSVRYWDKAGTSGGGARTAGVLMHTMKDGRVVISDVVKGQWSAGAREKRILQVAKMDGKDVKIWCEQEPGSGGKESAENTVRNLAGFRARAERVTGDKVTRADPFAAQVEAGNVLVVKSEWTEDYLRELETFPNGKFKDQVDASSGAFNKLHAKAKKRAGTW